MYLFVPMYIAKSFVCSCPTIRLVYKQSTSAHEPVRGSAYVPKGAHDNRTKETRAINIVDRQWKSGGRNFSRVFRNWDLFFFSLRALVLVHLSPYNYYYYSIIILTLLLILACQKGKFIDSSIDRCIRQDFLLQLVFSLLVLLLPAK